METLERKLANDATDKVKGILYQLYAALQYCFELLPGEVLYIEKFGDITISNLQQIEVKNYSNALTDTHDNLWKTIYNWCSKDFDPKLYKNLILLTTQKIGKNSKFINWNEKNTNEKFDIIHQITSEYCKKNNKGQLENQKAKIKQMNTIISNENKEKLLLILKKFIILHSSPAYNEIFENIKNKYAKHITDDNREIFLNELLGYLINPKTVGNNWSISYEKFTEQVQHFSSIHCAKTIIFPEIKKPSEEEIGKKIASLFVDKINAIEYEEVKNEAICDFLSTNTLLLNDFSKHELSPKFIEKYEDEIMQSFNPKRRAYSRKVSSENDRNIIINESKDFYDAITSEAAQPFLNYNDTPKSFRNGFYHIMADDDKNANKIVWLLKNAESKND